MPDFARAGSLSDLGGGVAICATHRLARQLRAAHDQAQGGSGRQRWAPLQALSLDAWLAQITDEALLDGSLPAQEAPRLALSALQEQVLWDQVIAAEEQEDGAEALFDREGLAAIALEANYIAETWKLAIGEATGAETQAFLRWRSELRARCRRGGWLEAARLRAWRIDRIAAGVGRLPERVGFAGFDRYTPQEVELARALAARGVRVLELELGHVEDAAAATVALPDRAAECRAAAAWAAQRLAANPRARLGIVVPDLSSLRDALADALDDALHPQALAPARSEMRRRYNFSLGAPLARWPVVDAALRLLRMAAQPRRTALEELARLLRSPYWSQGGVAMEARARFDARLRELLPPTVALSGVLRLARRLNQRGLPLSTAVRQLESLLTASTRLGKERASAWPDVLLRLLGEAGWPGDRPLSSHEWQAAAALRETLQGIAAVDGLLGRLGLGEAVRLATRLCRERVFQPQTEGRPEVEVLGPLEAAGSQFDAVWVMGMNDDAWPPPARPNPLLPAALQRRAGSPNAGAEVQLEFARSIHRRLLRSAPEAVFSWSLREGDRPLRPSPLLEGMPAGAGVLAPAATPLAGAAMEILDDSIAPTLPAEAKLSGGVGLLKAQAICPAWAFYRYRLGARALAEPVDGLNAADRGTLLHRVMERFWQGRDSAGLARLAEDERKRAVAAAVEAALADFNGARELPLSPRFAALEGQRLARLLTDWLSVELARPSPFAVLACEQSQEVLIEGLRVDVRVDRVDALAGGGRLILDYKTGRDLRLAAWLGERIVEPQLPAYAAYAAGATELAAVAFARVRADGCGFVGLGAAEGLLPGVKAAADWPATLADWRAAIAAVAREILAGEAAVRVADAKALEYCEVLPLLRLPERRAQMEGA